MKDRLATQTLFPSSALNGNGLGYSLLVFLASATQQTKPLGCHVPSQAQKLSQATRDGPYDAVRSPGAVSRAMRDGLGDMEGPPALTSVLRQWRATSLPSCKEFPLAACKSLWKMIWFVPTLGKTSSSSVPPLTASHSLSRCLHSTTFHWEAATWTGTETDSESFPGPVGKQSC